MIKKCPCGIKWQTETSPDCPACSQKLILMKYETPEGFEHKRVIRVFKKLTSEQKKERSLEKDRVRKRKHREQEKLDKLIW